MKSASAVDFARRALGHTGGPATTHRLEVVGGAFSFELRGFSSEQHWDAHDVELAERVYRGQRVWLSDSRNHVVAPPEA